ncbi:hypothetical protein PVAP13_6NG248803 [Panicum virgatum]|uniref:Uncharacterized protein n=1 Tax=Panicum virgatum TaxID=38727 RepID=A0A8T0R240_PANVG|nr:hypothetical protein PVAP13_6NG248803 [Panicum virgatum]
MPHAGSGPLPAAPSSPALLGLAPPCSLRPPPPRLPPPAVLLELESSCSDGRLLAAEASGCPLPACGSLSYHQCISWRPATDLISLPLTLTTAQDLSAQKSRLVLSTSALSASPAPACPVGPVGPWRADRAIGLLPGTFHLLRPIRCPPLLLLFSPPAAHSPPAAAFTAQPRPPTPRSAAARRLPPLRSLAAASSPLNPDLAAPTPRPPPKAARRRGHSSASARQLRGARTPCNRPEAGHRAGSRTGHD